MSLPDFEGASQYALERLRRELAPTMYYHSLAHTCDDVVPAVERLAGMLGVDGEELLLLRTAAFYHDLGFVERYGDNEDISVRIAGEVLPRFGYSPAQIAVIAGIIMATRLPQTPQTCLEAILADADLGVLGREDFFERNAALRNELAAMGQKLSDEEWYREQLAFFRAHHFFTDAARQLHEAGQQLNQQRLEALWQRAREQAQAAGRAAGSGGFHEP